MQAENEHTHNLRMEPQTSAAVLTSCGDLVKEGENEDRRRARRRKGLVVDCAPVTS